MDDVAAICMLKMR